MNEASGSGNSSTPTARKSAQHAEAVQRMREHWRREAEAERAGDATAAARAKERGDRESELLIEGIKGSLAHIANAYFRDGGLTDDGVCELIVALYEKLRDLSETPSARGWENPATFWKALKNNASNLFLREKQRDYGRQLSDSVAQKGTDKVGEEKETAGGRGREVSAERKTAGPVEMSPPGPEEGWEAPDREALRPFEGLMEEDAVRALLEAIPNEQHRNALIWDAQGVPQEEIARRLGGKTVKTVYNYIRAARERAAAWAAGRYRTHGEFGEYLGREVPGGGADRQ